MNTQTEESIYSKIQEWLSAYRETSKRVQKKRLENLIVVAMMPIIKKIARSIARRAEDPVEDLVQAGAIGLVKAIEKYTPEKNPKFRIYAGYLIVGEMQHYMRDKVAMIKVPREVLELALSIKNFSKTLSEKELEKLTDEKVAQALEVPVQKIKNAIDIDRRRKVISLDEIVNDSENKASIGDLTPSCDYDEFLERYDMKIELDDVIERLPADLKEIIRLFYYQDMKQKTIAERLNINEMMVSRKLKKAYSLMYKYIKDSEVSE